MEKIDLSSLNHIAFRLPNWLGDICMALPVIKAIQTKARTENPDMKFSLLMRPQYVSLLEKLDVEGEKIPLPHKNWQYFFRCLKWQGNFDAQIMFTNSERGDIESWLMRSPKRIGIARSNKPRRFLTHRYMLPSRFDEDTYHQTMLWQDLTSSFGLHDGIDLAPVYPTNAKGHSVGLICGSANTPEKRWAIKNWQNLIRKLFEQGAETIVLFGTHEDSEICHQVAFADERVQNLAGKTNLAELIDLMRKQSMVIGNDTGGIHLANALGVPVIGLYGLTNPIRSRPIHHSPLTILQSQKGYGEGKMDDITVAMVIDAIKKR